MDSSVVCALIYKRNQAKELQNCLGIAEDYKGGMSLGDIATNYDVCGKFGVEEGDARDIVHIALGGNRESIGPSFAGLLTPKEMEKYGKEHQRDAGMKTFKNGVGMFGLSEREEEQRNIRGGRAGAVLKGYVLWKKGEGSLAYILSMSDVYKSNRGISSKLIAECVNNLWHEGESVRNANSIRAFLMKYRKKKVA